MPGFPEAIRLNRQSGLVPSDVFLQNGTAARARGNGTGKTNHD